jgi:hypothetical protein
VVAVAPVVKRCRKLVAHPEANLSFDFSYKGWGYTKATITEKAVAIISYGVDSGGSAKQVDSATVNLS